MLRKVCLLGMFALVGTFAVAACDDNPLSEGRDDVDRIDLNPSFANVKVADSTRVYGIAVNRHGEPLGVAVSATACDNKITIAPDPTRTNFEPPERFVVKGVTAGDSCINFTAGGKEATATILVLQ
jgi:hypothetical protein